MGVKLSQIIHSIQVKLEKLESQGAAEYYGPRSSYNALGLSGILSVEKLFKVINKVATRTETRRIRHISNLNAIRQ